MATISKIKSRLIDQIMVTTNEKLLAAIDDIFKSIEPEVALELNSHQIEMLLMSDRDIKEGNIISEEDLYKEDSKWMD